MTDKEQQKRQLKLAARSPEGKTLLAHLLTQAQTAFSSQDPLVFKGYMAAVFELKDLIEKD